MRGRHAKPGGISVTAFQVTIMILLGTLGVLLVLGSHLVARPHGRRRAA